MPVSKPLRRNLVTSSRVAADRESLAPAFRPFVLWRDNRDHTWQIARVPADRQLRRRAGTAAVPATREARGANGLH
jgi:hypothetical protein